LKTNGRAHTLEEFSFEDWVINKVETAIEKHLDQIVDETVHLKVRKAVSKVVDRALEEEGIDQLLRSKVLRRIEGLRIFVGKDGWEVSFAS